MKAVVATDRSAEAAGIVLADVDVPNPAINDVVVEVHASGFVLAEWEWPSTWVERSGRQRRRPIIGHEFAGIVTALGYGTTGLSVGQRVFGITDWHRDGTMAEYVAVEARNLAPLPGAVGFTVGASLPISALTAWQGLLSTADCDRDRPCSLTVRPARWDRSWRSSRASMARTSSEPGGREIATRRWVSAPTSFSTSTPSSSKTLAASTWCSTSSALISNTSPPASSDLAARSCPSSDR